jgi:hypothetical protein
LSDRGRRTFIRGSSWGIICGYERLVRRKVVAISAKEPPAVQIPAVEERRETGGHFPSAARTGTKLQENSNRTDTTDFVIARIAMNPWFRVLRV